MGFKAVGVGLRELQFALGSKSHYGLRTLDPTPVEISSNLLGASPTDFAILCEGA